MKGPLDIHQYLLAHNVHHEIVRLRRPAGTSEQMSEALDVSPRRCIVVHPFFTSTVTGDVLVALLTPSDIPVDAALIAELGGTLAAPLGEAPTVPLDLRPAGSDRVSSHTDYLASHLAPLLLPADVMVAATRSLADLATSIVYTATGDGGTALGIRATDLLDLCGAIVLHDASVARPERIDLATRVTAPIQLDHAPARRRTLEGRGASSRTRQARTESDVPDPGESASPAAGDASSPHDLLGSAFSARPMMMSAAESPAAAPTGSTRAAVTSST